MVERDLGRLEAGARAAVEFPWRWSGPGDLRVLALETDCGCAVASGLPDVVPEGARGTFVLDMKGRSRPGPFDHVVRLRVDRAPDAVLRLRVRGFVGSAVAVDPPELDLGRLSVGRSVVRVVTVRPPPPSGDRPREDGRMRASLLEDRRPADRRVEARLVGLEGTCEVRGTARPGVDGADVLVRAQVPERAGPFHGHVEVRVAGEGVWRLPLRGEAVDGGASVPAAPRTAGAPVPAGEAGTGPERRPR